MEDDFELRQEVFDIMSLVLFRNGNKLSIKSGLYSSKVNKINIATVKEYIINNIKEDQSEDVD